MIRCAEGHFYDPAKQSSCPWCGVASAAQASPADSLHEGKTQPVRPVDRVPPPLPPSIRTPEGATKALHRQASGVSPVVGWLVCVEGPDRGQDYRIHMEKNFVGRSPAMDIPIANDDSISREKHAAITFDPKKRVFWLVPGESTGLVYLNETLVNSPVELKADDVIELGKSKLVLVPFASEKFPWQ